MSRAAAAALALVATAFAAPARAGEVTAETHEGRAVRVFTPSKPAAAPAAVVMLHGCTQTAEDFADATQMDAVAEERGFYVLYPEQPASTGTNRCWRWYDSAHQRRDQGEPRELAELSAALAAARGVPEGRVYVAGISAGAAMTVILGATYPDRFAGLGVIAGLEYGAATSLGESLQATASGGPDPKVQGEKAHAAMGEAARAVPVLVLHGTSDGVVSKVNGEQVFAQWLHTNELALGAGAIGPAETEAGEAGYPFTRTFHRLAGKPTRIVEHVSIEGLGHAWPGGRAGGSFADPKGPDASRMLATFFLGDAETSPSPAPDGAGGAAAPGPGAAGSDASAQPTTEEGGGCAAGRRSTAPASSSALALAALLLVRRRRGCTEASRDV